MKELLKKIALLVVLTLTAVATVNAEEISQVEKKMNQLVKKYENIKKESYGNINFHTRYEAKTFCWLKDNIDYKKEKTCMWIVGGEIV